MPVACKFVRDTPSEITKVALTVSLLEHSLNSAGTASAGHLPAHDIAETLPHMYHVPNESVP